MKNRLKRDKKEYNWNIMIPQNKNLEKLKMIQTHL